MPQYAPTLDVSTLDASQGFSIAGAPAGSDFAVTLAAGDFNNDGVSDLIVGADKLASGGGDAGGAYVIYGSAGLGASGAFSVADLNGDNGFRIDGAEAQDAAGGAVAAGDVNHDGYADFIIGAVYSNAGGANMAEGSAWVVYGHGGATSTLDLSDVDGSNGFRIDGTGVIDEAGLSVSSGDLNGDGYQDAIVSSVGSTDAGRTYVVFGDSEAVRAPVDAGLLDGSNGFVVADTGDSYPGSYAVSGAAGDFNGDGKDDLLVHGILGSNAYIVYGADTFAASVSPAALDGHDGLKLTGAGQSNSTLSLSAAGDVNGDGYADIIIAGDQSSPAAGYAAGEAHVVFGRADGVADIDVSSLDGSDGFTLQGTAPSQGMGAVVKGVGDFNGDGFDDVFINASSPDTPGYVVFGKAGGFDAVFDPASLNGDNGFSVTGAAGYAFYSATSGDINGDGLGDLVLGDNPHGEAYVIYGRLPGQSVNRVGAAADQTILGSDFADTLSGLGGDDALRGNGGKDLMYGGDGADTLIGGAGVDRLFAAAGADRLVSRGDGDYLNGGGGDDVFVFTAISASRVAVLAGVSDTDVIDLSAIDTDPAADGDQGFSLVTRFSHQAGEMRIAYNQASDRTHVNIDLDGDGFADHHLIIKGDAHDFSHFMF